MPRALFSVSDKTGIGEFAASLVRFGWEIIASGGTRDALLAEDIPVTSVEQVTGQAELLGGRVKTLHPAIHAGILARDTDEDLKELERFGIAPIAMVVCNLYPFVETLSSAGTDQNAVIEQIDIGGVSLLRAAAKNFSRVTAICDAEDYPRITTCLQEQGRIDIVLRRQLAAKAFAHTRDYDASIHAYLDDAGLPAEDSGGLPQSFSLNLLRGDALRYGENPHQRAAFYASNAIELPLGAEQLGGRQLSYNNILDCDAAWRAVDSFSDPTVVIVKHLNPTGIASANSVEQAIPAALASDPLSAFGGIVAVNRAVDEPFVSALGALFVEAIIAPAFTESALQRLHRGRKNCRLLQVPRPYALDGLEIRAVMGGLLLQSMDMGDPAEAAMRVVTRRAPQDAELETLRFAWNAARHVKSNAIVLAQETRTVGIGGGLPSRVDAVELAIKKAGREASQSVMASDAFFPFPDSIETAARAGVACVIQPGGSIRDAQVIEAADNHNMAMIFTGSRHFRH